MRLTIRVILIIVFFSLAYLLPVCLFDPPKEDRFILLIYVFCGWIAGLFYPVLCCLLADLIKPEGYPFT